MRGVDTIGDWGSPGLGGYYAENLALDVCLELDIKVRRLLFLVRKGLLKLGHNFGTVKKSIAFLRGERGRRGETGWGGVRLMAVGRGWAVNERPRVNQRGGFLGSAGVSPVSPMPEGSDETVVVARSWVALSSSEPQHTVGVLGPQNLCQSLRA